MTEDRQDDEYLDLFKPKSDAAARSEPEATELDSASSVRDEGVPSEEPLDLPTVQATPARQPPRGPEYGIGEHHGEPRQRPEQSRGPGKGWANPIQGARSESGFEQVIEHPNDTGRNLRMVGIAVGAGCLLLMLTAVVVFAFFQVFVRRENEVQIQDTPTSTAIAAITPSPTVAVAKSPVFVPFVDSSDVRVPIAVPKRLIVGETVFVVQPVNGSVDAWPVAPTDAGTANWVYGTVVNYVLALAPTSENFDLVSALRGDETLSMHMSTGLILNFGVEEKLTGVTDETVFFEQVSPRLTLALLTGDPSQRIVVSASFASDEASDEGVFAGAAIGLIGTPVNQGPVRVTVMETYQVAGEQAGLPAGTGYFLLDLRVENIGTTVLEPEHFQMFVADQAGERYPLMMLAEQFAHFGIPSQALAPGETVIGSVGFLVSQSSEGQARWIFNPQPGSDSWMIVPVSIELPPPAPTPEPPMPAGFARVTVDTRDVFVNRGANLLDIGLRIENVSVGVVQVTEDDISLSSRIGGELPLVAPAPRLPWTLEPGELQLFQLQFELPSADSALLSVLGYTFSIENLGGE